MEIPMNKLIAAYRASPSLENALKVRAYDRKHPLAACVLTISEAETLRLAIRHADTDMPF